ncbi:hypothetical protein D3C72_1919570 [compost metagenome]
MHGVGVALQLLQRHELVGGVGLGDVARAVDQRGVTTGGKQRGLGPEVHRVADRDLQRIGHVTRGQAAVFGLGDVTGRETRTTEGLGEHRGLRLGEPGKGGQQRIDIHRRQRSEAETQLGGRGDHVGLDPTFHAPDVETQAGQPAKACM